MPTALIVEDEPDANALLSMLVRLRGYRTESALGGSEALRLLDRCRPDVVLLDLMLPDIDGFEVCRTIKADRELALIPVVVVSATRASENESRSYGAGANDFVPKPYTPDQIFRALEAAEAWRRDLASRPSAGDFAIDPRDPIEPLREFSRLRSILRAWTPLAEGDLLAIAAALRESWASAIAWGRDHEHRGPVAEVRFRIEEDRVALCLVDHAGWFVDGAPPRDERLARAVFGGGFDVVARADEAALELIRPFPTDDR